MNIFNNKKNVDNKEVILHAKNGRKIYARTLNQLKIVKEIDKNDIVFSNGPAGTGKTYTAVAIAVNFLKNKKVKKIILTRPAIEAGENIGYLPGDIKNKLDEFGFNTCTSNSLENALKKADDKIPLLITGSLYLAGCALKFNETIID